MGGSRGGRGSGPPWKIISGNRNLKTTGTDPPREAIEPKANGYSRKKGSNGFSSEVRMTLCEIHTLGSFFFFFFWGGGGGGGGWGVKMLNINIFWGFQINEYFLDEKILWIFYGGHHKIEQY